MHSRSIRNDAAAPAAARNAVSTIANALTDDRAGALRLLVSEVVSNGVKHGLDGTIVLSTDQHRDFIRVEVTNASDGLRPERLPNQTDRIGLLLVEQLAARWGHRSDKHQTRVWFELDTVPTMPEPAEA
jgi:two-component sensor histidine kinase